jgi:hypothetical protein
MPWNWMILIGAFILGMNLGVVLMGVLAANRRDCGTEITTADASLGRSA